MSNSSPRSAAVPLSAPVDRRPSLLRIASGYLLAGLLWVWVSDTALFSLNAQTLMGYILAGAKGSLFFLLTAPVLYWLIHRDVQAITRTNALLTAVTEGTTDAVFVKDDNGRYLLFNSAASRLVGRPVAEVLGRDDTALFDPDGVRLVREADRRVMESGVAFTSEERLTAAGVERTYLATKAPLRDDNGAIVGVIGISRDITERVAALATMRENEARLREAQRIAHLGSWTWEPHSGQVWWSDAIYELFGFPRDTTPSFDAFLAVLHPDDRACALARVERVLNGSDGFANDLRIIRPDGQLRWIRSKARATRDGSGTLRRFEGTDQDITARKEAELALRAERDRTALLLERLPIGYLVLDAERRITYWNPAAERIFGFRAEEVLGRSPFDFIVPDKIRSEIRQIEDELTTGRANVNINENLTRDGRTILCEWTNTPLLDEAGRFAGIVGMVEDITARHQAQEVLRESEELFRLTFEEAAVGIAHVATDGRLLRMNRRFAEIVGYTDEELMGKSFPEITHPDDVAEDMIRVKRILAGEVSRYVFEKRYIRKDGETVWVNLTVALRRSANGDPLYFISVIQDITARRRTEEALRESETRARRGEALLSAVMEAMPVSVIIADETGRLVNMNPASRVIWGPAPMSENVDGYREYVGYWPGTGKRVEAQEWPMARAVLAGETSSNVLVEIERFGGGRGYLEISGAPVVGDDGTRLGGVVACADVTARVNAEAALRRSEERLDQAVRASGFGVFDHDHERGTLYWSPRLREIYGYDLETPASLETYLDLIHPDDRDAIASAVTRAHDPAGDGRFDVEHRLIRPSDGQIRWVMMRSQTTFEGVESERRLSRTVGAVMDVTSAREAEVALRESEWRFRQVFENAPTGIGITDATGHFLRCNPAYCAVLGRTEDELRVTDLASLIHPDDREENMDVLRRLATGGIPSYEIENRFLHKSGEPVWVRKQVSALQDPEGRVTHLMALVTNVTERRRAEQELREGAERLRLAIQAANIGLWDWDIQTNRVLFSPEWKAQLGYTPDEIDDTLSEWESRVHPDDLGPAREIVQQTLSGERDAHESEFRMRHKDGSWRWIYTRAEVIRDATGKPVRMLGGHIDVTARKRAESELRSSEERYRRLVEVLPEALFINSDDRVSFCNSACVTLFGAPDAESLVGKTAIDLFMPEFHDAIRARIEQMRKTGNPVIGLDEQIIRLDGRTVPVHVVATPINEEGRTAVLVCLRDLSERERALGLLRTVLGSVGDAILTIDTRGIVESANPATERLFGFAESELIGQNVRALMPEPDRGRHDSYIANFLRTGQAHVIGIGREVDGRRKDGTVFPVELTVTEFRLDGERRFTGVLRDITARRRLEDQFRQAQKMEAVGRLAGGVAHDFNNLLTVINGYTDLLMFEQPEESPSRAYLVAVRDAGERAAALTAQLLAFSRKALVAPKVFDLKDVATQSEKLLRRLIGEDIVLTLVLHPAPCMVRADPNQVDQVIMNLAVNARDAMPTGGRLTLETRPVMIEATDPAVIQGELRPGRYIEMTVTDTGCGMPPEVQARIFEPFYTTKAEGQGTGLGLATVFGIIHQAGGHVSLTSEVGRGTTFRIVLPEAEGVTVRTETLRPLVGRGTETVLLVEDDAAVRQLSRLALETQGYKVIAAGSGREALTLLQSRPDGVDLVVTDVVMPEMSGRQLADAVRTARPGTKVLFVSGYTDDAVMRHGVRDATDAFLQKPFTPLGLARKVREVLDAGCG